MKQRFEVLDSLRGLTLISMVAYHTVWDLVYVVGFRWKWYESTLSYIWQQSICWCFILLSGFCWSMGGHRLRRGLTVFGAGALVSAVTILAVPGQRVIFGVLTLLGTCMLLLIPLEGLLKKLPAVPGLAGSILLFVCTRNVNDGYLGFEGMNLFRLPSEWYCMENPVGMVLTALGFTNRTFFSTDYFALFPWIFLYLTGYFLYRLADREEVWNVLRSLNGKMLPFQWIGRHSLIIYMLHQPVIYLGLLILA